MNTRISINRNEAFKNKINLLNEEIDELEVIKKAIKDYNVLSYKLKNTIDKKNQDILYYEHLEQKVWDLLSELAHKYNAYIDSLDDIHRSKSHINQIKERLEIGENNEVTHIRSNNEKIPLYSDRNHYNLFVNGLRPMKVLIVDDKIKNKKLAYPILGINMQTPEFIHNRLKMSNLEKKVYDDSNNVKIKKESIKIRKEAPVPQKISNPIKSISNIFPKSPLIDLKSNKGDINKKENSKPQPIVKEYVPVNVDMILSKVINVPLKVGPRQKILSALESYLDILFGESQYPAYLAKKILDDYIVYNRSGNKWLYNLMLNNNYSSEIRNIFIKYNVRSSNDIKNIFISKNGKINTQIFWFQLHSITPATVLENISESIIKIIKQEYNKK